MADEVSNRFQQCHQRLFRSEALQRRYIGESRLLEDSSRGKYYSVAQNNRHIRASAKDEADENARAAAVRGSHLKEFPIRFE